MNRMGQGRDFPGGEVLCFVEALEFGTHNILVVWVAVQKYSE
jgi:hypothetical protein